MRITCIYLLPILLLLFLPLNAQENPRTEINNDLYNKQIQVLLDSSSLTIGSNAAKASGYLQKAIELTKKEKDEEKLAQIYLEYAKVSAFQNEPEQELHYVLRAKDLFTKYKNEKGLSKSLIALARINLNSWRYTAVLEYSYDALNHAYKSGDSVQIALSYHHLGTAYNWLNNFITYSKKLSNATWGNNFTIPGNKPSGKLFYQYCDSSEVYFQKAIVIMKRINYQGIPYSFNNLGVALHKRACLTDRNFKKALEAHYQAFKYFKKQNDVKGISSSFQEIAKCFREQNKYKESILLLNRSITIADSINYIPQLEASFEDLAQTYYFTQNMDSAFKYFRKYVLLRVRQINIHSKTLLTEQETKYKTEKKEARIAIQDKELEAKEARLKLQYLILLISSLGILILGAASIILYTLFKKNKALNQKNALFLKEQNHRVKNNLQVISALLSLQANRMDNSDAKKAIEDSQLRVQAMGLIHKKLYGDNVVEIDMKSFFTELAEAILPVFGFHAGCINQQIETAIVTLNVDKAVPLALILNELLTNSCKYAFSNSESPGFSIDLVDNGKGSLTFSYGDNGPGFDYYLAGKKGSFGLKLIELQSRQIFGEFNWGNQSGTSFCVNFTI